MAAIEQAVDRIVSKHMAAHERRLRAVLRRQVLEDIEDASLMQAMLKVDTTKTVSRAAMKRALRPRSK